MKKLTAALALTLSAATAVTVFSGCNIIKDILGGRNEPTTSVQIATNAPAATTAAATTAAATTEAATTEAATEAPTTESSSVEWDYPIVQDGGFVLVTDDTYTDDTLGITFTIPEWKGKVYAVTGTSEKGSYYLEFYEASNLIRGIEKYGRASLGFLFSVSLNDEESNVEIDHPAGSVVVNGQKKYLTYFKPTDVRCDYEDEILRDNYQDAYQYQRDYFQSGVVRGDMQYSPSANTYSVNLNTN